MNSNEIPKLVDPAKLGEEVRLTADLLRASGEYEALLEETDSEDVVVQSTIHAATEVRKEEIGSLLEQYLEAAINKHKVEIATLVTEREKEVSEFRAND